MRSVSKRSERASCTVTEMELLERRTLFSMGLSNGALWVVGTDGPDVIEFQRRAEDGQIKVTLNGTERRFDASQVRWAFAWGLGGNDFIEYSGRDDGLSVRGVIRGGAGNDTIQTGHGSDLIFGDDGNDWLQGKGGNDFIWGGRGNDRIEGSDGNDFLWGNAGRDSISGNDGRDWVLGDSGDDDLQGGSGIDTIWGGSGNDDFDDSDSSSEIKDRKAEDNGPN